jgi:tyrosine-protein kinase Etk/Wzc
MNSNQEYPVSQNYSRYNNFPVEDNPIDFRHYFGLFLSNWYWFAAALFCAGLLAYGINTYSEKVYTVSSSILIVDEQSGTDMTGLEKLIPGGDLFASRQNLQNEIGILKSYSLNYRVMQELPDFHLTIVGVGRRGIAERRHYKSAPFIVKFDSLKDQRTRVPVNIRIRSDETYSIEINGDEIRDEISFGEKFNDAGFNFTIIKAAPANFKFNKDLSNRYILWFNSPEMLANTYKGKLGITPVNDEATLLSLSVSGVVPLQEAEYLNKLMEVYIQQGLDFKNKTADSTIRFIDKQLAFISDSLTRAENKLENFRLKNRFIDLSSEGSAIKTKLESYAQEKIVAGLQKQYYEYLANYIKTRNESGEIMSPSVMGVADQLLIGLVNELADLQIQKKQLKYNFAGDQPAIGLIDSKIEDTRMALDENIRNCIFNVDITLKDIDSRISSVENELNKLPGTERRLINIQRQFDLNNTVYTYMLEKRSEAGIAKASTVPDNRIIDRAEPFNSSRISPRQNRNYMFAILLGLLVPGLYIFLVDQMNNKIIDKRDIEKGTDVPIIGFIGHNAGKNDMPVFTRPGSSLAESFRTLRTNLKYYINSDKKVIISITSTLSGEGKTFMSTNLATVISMLGRKTLLVCLDLRKPRLNKILNINSDSGVSTYLIGESDFEDIIQNTEFNNLYYIPSGSIPPNPAELIESERMKTFMEKAKKEFDYIILDTPPVGIVTDALLLAAYADMNIFVLRQKFSYKTTLEFIQNLYEKKEIKNLAIAVNDISISGYYGYGLRYGYGFYQGYGYNYGYGTYGAYKYGNYSKYYTED